MKLKQSFLFILLLVNLQLLISCGFHLVNPQTLSKTFPSLYIKTNEPYSSFNQLLINRLNDIDIQTVKYSQGSPWILTIGKPTLKQKDFSLHTQTNYNGQQFIYSVDIKLSHKNSKKILLSRIFKAQSIVTPDRTPLEGQRSHEVVITSLQNQIIDQLLDELSAALRSTKQPSKPIKKI